MSSSVASYPGVPPKITIGTPVILEIEDATADPTFDFGSVAIGAADASRHVFVFAIAHGTTDNSRIGTISIGGTNASEWADDVAPANSEAWMIASRAIPAGTTTPIIVTTSADKNRCRIIVVPVYGAASTPVAGAGSTATSGVTSGSSHSISGLVCPAQGARLAFLGMRYTGFGTPVLNWTGASEIAEDSGDDTSIALGGALSYATSGDIVCTHSSDRACLQGVGLTPAP